MTAELNVCPLCKLAGHAIADERDAAMAGLAEWKRLAEEMERDKARLDWCDANLQRKATIRLDGEAAPRACLAWSITAAGGTSTGKGLFDETEKELVLFKETRVHGCPNWMDFIRFLF